MKTILLVDDDALVLELYRKKLAQAGFDVRTAADGLEAVKSLTQFKPDFVVLDLMMPKLSGADVLKFIRSKPELTKVPVAALTNSFMSDQARAVNSLGVERAIVKGDCTPAKMLEIVCQSLGVKPGAGADSPGTTASDTAQINKEAQEAFLKKAPEEFTDLQTVSQEFARDPAAASRSGNLQEFFHQAHHLAGAAALARCQHVAQLASALEALLFELGEKPQLITHSTARTVGAAVDFLGKLIEHARKGGRGDAVVGEVLAVDDDPLANRIALAALTRAKLNAKTVENPLTALELAARQNFDLILLDVEMPHLNGFELCEKIRELPGYSHTPIIYVTSHTDFENQVRRVGLGGQDLIAKPIFPIELAVKAVMHVIANKLAAPAEARA